MKYVLLFAASAAALTGCQKAADSNAPAASSSSAMAPAAAPAMVTANGSAPGTYDVTAKDGTKTQSMLMADGSYKDVDAKGKQTAQGKWNVTGGKTCFDPDGDEGPTCYAEGAPGADGTFTATPDKGDPITVKRTG